MRKALLPSTQYYFRCCELSKHVWFQKVYLCKRQGSRQRYICSARGPRSFRSQEFWPIPDGVHLQAAKRTNILNLEGNVFGRYLPSNSVCVFLFTSERETRFVARGRFKSWCKWFFRCTTTCLKECNVNIWNIRCHDAPWRLLCNQTWSGVLPYVHVFQPLAG